MKARSWLQKLQVAAALALAAALLSGATPTGANTRPNIVFIMVDDASTMTLQHMPQTQALIADRGATLTQFVYNQPLCCPSRATMLRGQYSQNTGIVSNDAPDGGFGGFYRKGHESSTLATWFEAAGYTTGYLGKYLNGYPGQSAGVPSTTSGRIRPLVRRSSDPPRKGFNYIINDDGVTRTLRHCAQRLCDRRSGRAEAHEFIRQAPAPFLLTVAPNAPHQPGDPGPPTRGDVRRCANTRARRRSTRQNVSDKPSLIRAPAADRPPRDRPDRRRVPPATGVAAGRRRDGARRSSTPCETGNLLADTYLLFTSDNGYFEGEHRLRVRKEPAVRGGPHGPPVHPRSRHPGRLHRPQPGGQCRRARHLERRRRYHSAEFRRRPILPPPCAAVHRSHGDQSYLLRFRRRRRRGCSLCWHTN